MYFPTQQLDTVTLPPVLNTEVKDKLLSHTKLRLGKLGLWAWLFHGMDLQNIK